MHSSRRCVSNSERDLGASSGERASSLDADARRAACHDCPLAGEVDAGGDLLWASRELAAKLELVGVHVVEVTPTGLGSADITALVAERIVREILTGLALRARSGT